MSVRHSDDGGDMSSSDTARTGNNNAELNRRSNHSRWSRFLLGIYGAEPAHVPKEERHYLHSTAFMMVAVTILATIGMAALLHTRWPEASIATLFGGLVWAFIVLSIDRSFTSMVERNPHWLRKALTAIPRVLVAVLAAFLVSECLVLLIFSNEVDQQIVRLESEYKRSLIEQESTNQQVATESAKSRKKELEDEVSKATTDKEKWAKAYICETTLRENRDRSCGDVEVPLSVTGGVGGPYDAEYANALTIAETRLNEAESAKSAFVNTLRTSTLSADELSKCGKAAGSQTSEYDDLVCQGNAKSSTGQDIGAISFSTSPLMRIVALTFIGEPVTVAEKNDTGVFGDVLARQKKYASLWHDVIFWLLLVIDLTPIGLKLFRSSTKYEEDARKAIVSAPVEDSLDVRRPLALEKALFPWGSRRDRTLREDLYAFARASVGDHWRNRFSQQATEIPAPRPLALEPEYRLDEPEPPREVPAQSIDAAVDPANSEEYLPVVDPSAKGNVDGSIELEPGNIGATTRLHGERLAKDRTTIVLGSLVHNESRSFTLRFAKVLDRKDNVLGPKPDSLVVAKITRTDGTDLELAWRRASLEKELRAMAGLSSHGFPFVAKPISSRVEYDDHHKVYFILVPYLPYGDLRGLVSPSADNARKLPQGGRITIDQALDIVEDLLTCLDAAHREGFYHSDIKPANILLDDGRTGDHLYTAVLNDWGDAKLDSDFNPTVTDGVRKSPYWASPEMLSMGSGTRPRLSEDAVEKRSQASDLYMLGATTYELIAGLPPRAMHAKNKGLDPEDKYDFPKCVAATLHSLPDMEIELPDAVRHLVFRWQNRDPSARQPLRTDGYSDFAARGDMKTPIPTMAGSALKELREVRSRLTPEEKELLGQYVAGAAADRARSTAEFAYGSAESSRQTRRVTK